MGLDLKPLIRQVGEATSHLQSHRQVREERLKLVQDTYRSMAGNLSPLRQKLARSKTTWLMAGIEEDWGESHPLPPHPPDFAILAADGSHIPPDRHGPVRCYLINLGWAYLQYGQQPQAQLESRPQLYYQEPDLTLSDPKGLRQLPIEGTLLEIKRSVEEARFLAERARAGFPYPTLALLDGSLILWKLAGKDLPHYIRDEFLTRIFLPTLEEIKRVPNLIGLAGYISFPHTTEVVNLLRLALCPYPIADCDRDCPALPQCNGVAGVEDRELFDHLLQPGERSPLFSSTSAIMRHYREHRIWFCYLKMETEVARLEFPCWVRGEALDLVHSLAFDQCHRGMGYPVALMEAHQKAVLTTSEREQFWNLVEATLEQRGLPSPISPKRRSKQIPWI